MKKIIALLGAFALAFCSVGSTCGLVHINNVSALVSSSSTVYITNGFTNISNFTSYEQQFLNAHIFPFNSFQVISERSGVNSGILSFDINSMHNWGVVSSENEQYVLYVNRSSRSSAVDYMPSYMDYQGNTLSLGSQTFFVSLPLSANGSAYLHNFPSDLLNGSNAYLDTYSDENIAFWGVSNGNYECLSKSYNTRFVSYTPSYVPDFSGSLVGFPVGLEFSVADFMQWLVDNDKIAVSADSGGVSVGGKIPAYIGLSKLQSFLEFYKQFGSSNSSFISRIGSWLSYMNIANQTNDNIVILKNTIDSLYREYINSYKQEFYSNSAYQAHHRRNVNTQTTDDDLILVTDDSNDDIYTTLLREIIRGIVALQSSTVSSSRAIIDTLNNLDLSVMLSNDGSVAATDLSVLWRYDSNEFDDDINSFALGVEDVQDIPQGYIDTINQNALMPENMLSDKNSLTVNVPCITGFTIGGNGSTYSTQTGTYTLSSSQYPWLDPIVQKFKRFGSIILIIGYLVHLRYRVPELVRGE